MLQRPLPNPLPQGEGSNSIQSISIQSNPIDTSRHVHYSSTGFGSTIFAAKMEIS